MESTKDALTRATAALAESEAIRDRIKARWQDARDTHGIASEQARYFYGRYLGFCREVARNKRWLEACKTVDYANR